VGKYNFTVLSWEILHQPTKFFNAKEFFVSLFCVASCLPSPSQLQMTHYSNTCLLLEWSSEAAMPTIEVTPAILGYRVYVNGIAEGQVFSSLLHIDIIVCVVL